MKRKLLSHRLSTLVLILIFGILIVGLQNTKAFDSPTDSGGGEYPLPHVPDLTDQERQEIQSEIDKNIELLGLQKTSELVPFSTLLSWPLQAANGWTAYGYHGTSGFVDHNAAFPDQVLDYYCGDRTYDLASGYNHGGTDISPWPFRWYRMDHDQIQVIAAAPGTIVYKQDGNYDRNCGSSSSPWNAVYVRHADGSVAWYGHLKKNSATPQPIGATVVAGEYLGVVGSSGRSNGPHLHFELHDAANHVIDPYAGPCNNSSSWWAAQKPYYDSAVNSLTTGNAAPVFPACPNPETSNAQDHFYPGDTIYFTTYYRDRIAGQESRHTIYKPDGTVYQAWASVYSGSHYATSYSYRSYKLEATAPAGLWRFQLVFNGQTYQHTFSVSDTVSLRGRPANRAIYLAWDVYGSLPISSTWQIAYAGVPGTRPSPITGLSNPTRAYTLTGLTNHTWYTVTLNAIMDTRPIMTATVRAMPTDISVRLPLVLR